MKKVPKGGGFGTIEKFAYIRTLKTTMITMPRTAGYLLLTVVCCPLSIIL